jgi:hypothetical protein
MEGVYIGKSRGIEWASISVLLAIASAAAAIFAGPIWVAWLSGAGLFLAVAALWKAFRAPSLEKPTGLPSIMIGVHALLLVTAAVLQSMFLSPLPPEARKIPVLQKPYVDPNGVFRIKGPVGWDFRPVPSSLETGVRMQPADKSLYMGVSEVTVFVRRLDKRPPSPEEFLKRAAASFSERRGGQDLFDLRTEKGLSLRNVVGADREALLGPGLPGFRVRREKRPVFMLRFGDRPQKPRSALQTALPGSFRPDYCHKQSLKFTCKTNDIQATMTA